MLKRLRNHFAGVALLGAAQLFGGQAHAQSDIPVYDAAAFSRHLSCDKPYLVLGDTNHKQAELKEFLAQPDTVDILKKCNVGAVFLEIRPVFQQALDDHAQGRTDTAAFLEAMRDYNPGSVSSLNGEASERDRAVLALARFVERTGKAGISIKAADFGNGSGELTQGAFFYKMGFEAWRGMLPEDLRAGYSEFLAGRETPASEKAVAYLEKNQTHPDYILGNEFFAKGEDLMNRGKALRTDDRVLTDFITANPPAAGKKIMVFYGDGHAKAAGGLFTLLGQDNVEWVPLAMRGSPYDANKIRHAGRPNFILSVPDKP